MQNQLRELIHQAGLDSVADKLISLSKPSIRITRQRVNEDDLPIGASRLGGITDLPSGIQWPRYEGRPLSLVAQLNMEDVAPHDVEKVLPTTGWLYFFYDLETMPWGEKEDFGKWRVIYYGGKNDQLARQNQSKTEKHRLNLCKLSFQSQRFIPTSWDFNVDWDKPELIIYPENIGLSKNEVDQYYQLVRQIIGENPNHWMLGHANPVQALMEKSCPSMVDNTTDGDDWLLLLQVDTDHELNIMWDDGGMIYYWIHKDALVAQNFDKVWLFLQCY